MNQKVGEISENLFHAKYDQLGDREKKVAHHLAAKTHISRNVAKDYSEKLTFGQRMADRHSSPNNLDVSKPTGLQRSTQRGARLRSQPKGGA